MPERRSKGYTNELEKVTRNDNDLSVTINLKTAAVKERRSTRFRNVEFHEKIFRQRDVRTPPFFTQSI